MNAHVSPALHDALSSIAFLIGTWSGAGEGRYPGIQDFEYRETTRFWHDGRPLLFYRQETQDPVTRAAMHSESGYWRPQPDGRLEIVLAHSMGIVEVQQGRVEGTRVETSSTQVIGTSSAKNVDALARTVVVDRDVLRYELHMAFGGHELRPHLRAELQRASQHADADAVAR